jgi:hypothetical protein
LIWWLVAASLVIVAASIVVVPMLLIRVPADYFSYEVRHHAPWANQHPVVRGVILIVKNVVGFVLVFFGVGMLVLPGQGMLTVLVGLMLLDFPGKYHLERWVVRRPAIARSINWLRRRAGRGPLVLDGYIR